MTTMQEALADKFLTPNSADAQAYFSDLMQRTYANSKYGDEGLSLSSGIPSKRQNKIHSGRASRKAARSRQALQKVGGIWNSQQPGLSIVKAIYAPADKPLCKVITNPRQVFKSQAAQALLDKGK